MEVRLDRHSLQLRSRQQQLNIHAKGRLIRLMDWSDQPRASWFYYNEAGQQTWALRPNGLWSEYDHRNDGYLWGVYHRPKFKRVLASFKSIVQPNGDRYSVDEDFIQYTTDTVTQRKSTPGVSFPKGSWTDTGDFKQTAKWGSVMEIAYTGERGWLAIGTGPNHGMIDISINGWFWRSFNGYEETIGEKVIEIPRVVTPEGETTGKVAIEVRSDNHHRSTGHVFRFKQLEGTRILSVRRPVPHTKVTYTYDGADRLQQADYEPGTDYDYDYDLAGNLTDNNGTARTYNAANQLTANGSRNLTYDANGNLTSDGVNTYTWDRANRLTQAGNTAYTYDGLGNRVSQTVNTTKTDYLLDVADSLPKVIAATTGNSTERYIHGPRGLHAKQAANGDWTYTLDDFLGSVRGWVDDDQQIVQTHSYDPYGQPTTPMTGFAFTGEMRDANGLQYHRARYYNPSLAGWLSLDPVQGDMGHPMSLNGYLYVNGNPVMNIDPTGMFSRTHSLTPGDGGGSRRTRRTRRTRRPTRNRGTVRTRGPVRTTGASEVKTRSTTSPLVRGVPAAANDKAVVSEPRSGKDPSPANPSGCPPGWDAGTDTNWHWDGSVTESTYCHLPDMEAVLSREGAWRSFHKHGYRREEVLQFATRIRDAIVEYDKPLITDFDLLALTADYSATLGASPRQIADDLSWIFADASGSSALVVAAYEAIVGGKPTPPINTGLKETPFGNLRNPAGSGLHPDYEDNQNQLFHFVPYVATYASGGDLMGGGSGMLGNYVHEDLGLPDFGSGASWQDDNLAYAGMVLGYGINHGLIDSNEIGHWIRTVLSQPAPFSNSANPQEYPWIEFCEIAKDKFGKVPGRFNNCQPSVPYPG